MSKLVARRFSFSKNSIVFLWLCMTLILAGCGGLGGEPPIVATLPPPSPGAVELGVPSEQPDIQQGAQIYAENCTRCHGETGQGNGELVLSGQLAAAPPDFTDPTTARAQLITNWYGTITNGRLEKFMPPWREKLSEQQRWAVALYTYTMSYGSDAISSGQAIWTANCAECHGETGVGDGSRASELGLKLSNLAQPDALIGQSDSNLFDTITQGKNDTMPAFGDKLDETQRWQVINYLRTLSVVNANAIGQVVPSPATTSEVGQAVPSPATTPEVEAASSAPVPGMISGQISNGTQGGTIDSGLDVILYIVDSQFNQETQQTTVASDGTYTFTDVPIQNDRAYVVTTAYQGRTFGSNMVQGDTTKPILDMPITVYDTTDDPSVISISQIVTQISNVSGNLQITQIMNFHNTSDHLYSQNNTVDGTRFASISISLPPGAQVQSTADDSQRYVLSQDGRSLSDTRPVYPNEDHIVHITYTLPFNGSAQIEMPLNYALNGSVQMLLEPANLKLTSPQLPAMSPQTMGETVFQTYGATLNLSTGDTLSYGLNSSSESSGGVVFSNNTLAYVFIGIGSIAILGAAILYLYERRTPRTNNQQIMDVLLEQISELDDLHQKGKIDPKAYEEQRQRLKERLGKLMNKK